MQTILQLLIDNNIAFHPTMGNSYKLNQTGKDILELLKEYKSKNEIVEIISKKYNVDKKDVFIDVGDFISKLRIYGLIS
jgi:septum formation topological specificity factor MinE